MLFMLFSIIMPRNGLKISEYKAYIPAHRFSTNNYLGMPRNHYADPLKKTQIYGKISNFTVKRDHSYIYKVNKQGWSPTPADILVGI